MLLIRVFSFLRANPLIAVILVMGIALGVYKGQAWYYHGKASTYQNRAENAEYVIKVTEKREEAVRKLKTKFKDENDGIKKSITDRTYFDTH